MTPPSAAQLERKLSQLDPLDVVIALTSRLALAIDRLQRLADACPACGGKGWTGELLEARRMTDDPRSIEGPHAAVRRDRIRRFGAMVAKMVCGAGTLKTPCPACAPIRETIRLCEGPKE